MICIPGWHLGEVVGVFFAMWVTLEFHLCTHGVIRAAFGHPWAPFGNHWGPCPGLCSTLGRGPGHLLPFVGTRLEKGTTND